MSVPLPSPGAPITAAAWNELQTALREELAGHTHAASPLPGTALDPAATLQILSLHADALQLGQPPAPIQDQLALRLSARGGSVGSLEVTGSLRTGRPLPVDGRLRPAPPTPKIARWDASQSRLQGPDSAQTSGVSSSWFETPLALDLDLAEPRVALLQLLVEVAGDLRTDITYAGATAFLQPAVRFPEAPSRVLPMEALARLTDPHDRAAWLSLSFQPRTEAGLLLPSIQWNSEDRWPQQHAAVLALPLPAGRCQVLLLATGATRNLRAITFSLSLLPR